MGQPEDGQASVKDREPVEVQPVPPQQNVPPRIELEGLEDPHNWHPYRKMTIAVTFSMGQLVTLMSASMMAAALPQITLDLAMPDSQTLLAISIYFVGLGLAPFLVAALSETYGRKPVWLGCNLFYILWNSLCPVGPSRGLLIVGRLLAGCGACAGVTLTAPVLADMYRAEERGKSLAIAGMLPYLGPALGPILGGLISQRVAWPWMFWIMSIFDALAVALGLVVIRESYAPILGQRKAARRMIDSEKAQRSPLNKQSSTFSSRLGSSVAKTMRLCVQRPIVQLIGFLLGLGFGVYCIILTTFASIYIEAYGQTPLLASLHYIALALGTFTSSQVSSRFLDVMYQRKLAAQPEGAPPLPPEVRIPVAIVPGTVVAPIGIVWYGVAIECRAHWALVDVGAWLFTAGTFSAAQGLLVYLLDEFGGGQRAASAGAATRVLSYAAGATFPIFAPAFYRRLGYGLGNGVLAILSTGLAAPAIAAMWLRGPKLRAIGRREED